MHGTTKQLTDRSGRPIKIGRRIGAGGEGEVFEVNGSPFTVAKIYHQPLTAERAAKIEAMIPLATGGIRDFCAWPTALLLEGRQPRGLLMPLIKDRKEVHVLHGPKSRKAEFPDAGFGFLVRTATNIARAVANVHAAGVVIGDFNDRGILVGRDGIVSLIDCDSFQIVTGTKAYLCEVGVPNYTPPELQGRNLRGVRRTIDHDTFGLAVLIFLLIFMGRHPYAGRYRHGTIELETAIKENRYAYSAEFTRTGMEPPPNTLVISHGAGDDIASLFERAFSPAAARGQTRPSAPEWVDALQKLGASLGPCQWNKSHVYARSQASCPWCQLEQRTGVDLFTFVPNDANATPAIDVEAIWGAIGAFRAPSIPAPTRWPPMATPPSPAPLPAALANLITQQRTLRFEADRARSVSQRAATHADEQERVSQFILDDLARSDPQLRQLEGSYARWTRGYDHSMVVVAGTAYAIAVVIVEPVARLLSMGQATAWLAVAIGLALILLYSGWRSVRAMTVGHLKLKLDVSRNAALLANPEAEQRFNAAQKLRAQLLEQVASANALASAMSSDEATHRRMIEEASTPLRVDADQRVKTATAVVQQADDAMSRLRADAHKLDQEITHRRRAAEQSVQQWRALTARRTADLKRLIDDDRIDQLDRYLDGFFIDKADIDGITPALKAALQSYNIETAADVTEKAVDAVPGFGPVRTKRMLSWKAKVSKGFRYVPGHGPDPTKRAAIERKHLTECRRYERDVKSLHDEISLRIGQISLALPGAQRAADDAINALAQAKANRAALDGAAIFGHP